MGERQAKRVARATSHVNLARGPVGKYTNLARGMGVGRSAASDMGPLFDRLTAQRTAAWGRYHAGVEERAARVADRTLGNRATRTGLPRQYRTASGRFGASNDIRHAAARARGADFTGLYRGEAGAMNRIPFAGKSPFGRRLTGVEKSVIGLGVGALGVGGVMRGISRDPRNTTVSRANPTGMYGY